MRIKSRRPSAFFYNILIPAAWVFCKLVYRLKVDKTAVKGIKPPYIILASHTCNIDYLNAACSMYPVRLNFVAGAYHFRSGIGNWAFRTMGAIPKEQFVPDPASIFMMRDVIKKGHALIVFPAGQSSFPGRDTFIAPNLTKLLKMLKAPVLCMHIDGGHMTLPKWDMTRIRRTRIDVRITPLFTAEQVAGLSHTQLYEDVVNALTFDDYEWQRKNRVPTGRPRTVRGLERVLFMCPKCGAEFKIFSQGCTLTCHDCGYEATMDGYGLLSGEKDFDTPVKWYNWQMRVLDSQLTENYRYESPASLCVFLKGGKAKKIGEGVISISLAGFCYSGTKDGQSVTMEIDSSQMPVFPHESETGFEAVYGGTLYRFLPARSGDVFKFVALEELVYKRRNSLQANY